MGHPVYIFTAIVNVPKHVLPYHAGCGREAINLPVGRCFGLGAVPVKIWCPDGDDVNTNIVYFEVNLASILICFVSNIFNLILDISKLILRFKS